MEYNYIYAKITSQTGSKYYNVDAIERLGFQPKTMLQNVRDITTNMMQTKYGICIGTQKNLVNFYDNGFKDLRGAYINKDDYYNALIQEVNGHLLLIQCNDYASCVWEITKNGVDYTYRLVGEIGDRYTPVEIMKVFYIQGAYYFINRKDNHRMVRSSNLTSLVFNNVLTTQKYYDVVVWNNCIYYMYLNNNQNSVMRYDPSDNTTLKIGTILTPFTCNYLELHNNRIYGGFVAGSNYRIYEFDMGTKKTNYLFGGANSSSIPLRTTREIYKNGLTVDMAFEKIIFNEDNQIKVYDIKKETLETIDNVASDTPVYALNLPQVKISRGWYNLKKLNEKAKAIKGLTFFDAIGYFYNYEQKGKIFFDTVTFNGSYVMLSENRRGLNIEMEKLFHNIFISEETIVYKEEIKQAFTYAVDTIVMQPTFTYNVADGLALKWDEGQPIKDYTTIIKGSTLSCYVTKPTYYERASINAISYHDDWVNSMVTTNQNAGTVTVGTLNEMNPVTKITVEAQSKNKLFSIMLYRNKSVNNKLGKDYIMVQTIDGKLKQATSLLTPTLIIETTLDMSQVNYMYIPLFNRFYFITDIVSNSFNLWEIHARVDVLSSFKTDILNSKAYILRNEYAPTTRYLVDNLRDLSSEMDIEFKDLQKYDFEFTGILGGDNDYVTETKGNYVWNVLNSNPVIKEVIEPAGVGRLEAISNVTAGYTKGELYVTSADATAQLINQIYTNDTYLSYIKSVTALPFDLYPFVVRTEGEKNARDLPIGDGAISVVEGDFKDAEYNNIIVTSKNFTSYHRIKYGSFTLPTPSSFLDFEPYSKYEIYLPYLNYVQLPYTACIEKDGNYYRAKTIFVYYNVNFEDGTGLVYLVDKYGNMIYSNTCQLGIRIGISTENNKEVTDQKNALAVSTVLSTIAGGGAIVGGVLMGNPLVVAGGVMSVVNSTTKAVTEVQRIYELGNSRITSGVQGLQLPQKAYLRISRILTSDNKREVTSDFKHIYGVPYNETKKINEVRGFTIASNLEIISTSATDGEVEQIKQEFSKGVYI